MQFAPKLKSDGGNFDPEEWAQLFADAGARFAGPVAEHHDGFSMWASKVNPWNAKDMGPRLDLVGLLTDAIRRRGMKTIVSMHHAYNITGFYDAAPRTDDPRLKMLYGQQSRDANEALWLGKHKEIIDSYRPDIIWQDFNLHRISEPVLLEFLSYYYNRAAEWGKEVVATYKDGLNPRCAVLDYERGGPPDIMEDYWLTDDAISSSSWSYTEGIGYYSQKQVFHGFLDRISKNGNLLLNISPKADGTIPREQKDLLLAMGAWLRKYGEAVYATRAWERYGEGPTRMGAAHGVMGPPREGTARDVRYHPLQGQLHPLCDPARLGDRPGGNHARIAVVRPDRRQQIAVRRVDQRGCRRLPASGIPAGHQRPPRPLAATHLRRTGLCHQAHVRRWHPPLRQLRRLRRGRALPPGAWRRPGATWSWGRNCR